MWRRVAGWWQEFELPAGETPAAHLHANHTWTNTHKSLRHSSQAQCHHLSQEWHHISGINIRWIQFLKGDDQSLPTSSSVTRWECDTDRSNFILRIFFSFGNFRFHFTLTFQLVPFEAKNSEKSRGARHDIQGRKCHKFPQKFGSKTQLFLSGFGTLTSPVEL